MPRHTAAHAAKVRYPEGVMARGSGSPEKGEAAVSQSHMALARWAAEGRHCEQAWSHQRVVHVFPRWDLTSERVISPEHRKAVYLSYKALSGKARRSRQ